MQIGKSFPSDRLSAYNDGNNVQIPQQTKRPFYWQWRNMPFTKKIRAGKVFSSSSEKSADGGH
jgi:hypothetical protein